MLKRKTLIISSLIVSNLLYANYTEFSNYSGTGTSFWKEKYLLNKYTHTGIDYNIDFNVGNGSQWVSTEYSCDNDECKVKNAERTTDYDFVNAKAYYETDSQGSITNSGQVWYDPSDIMNNYSEAIPSLSRTSNPSETNYDVYGIAEESIYGYLNLRGNFSRSSIIVRDLFSRSLIETKGNLDDAHRFLGGQNQNNDVNGINGNNKYKEGNYLFGAFVSDNDGARYGYPIKFSFVKKGNFIIDNDKPIDGSKSFQESDIEDNIVPGYFLTAELHKGRNGYFAKWNPNSKGVYKLYAHIPQGATATQVKYKVKNSQNTIYTKAINQSNNQGKWVQLEDENGNDNFKFESDTYVGISLGNDSTNKNYSNDSSRWIGIDAIKFEKVNDSKVVSNFHAAGSLIKPSGDCWGCNKDQANMQPDTTSSTVVFQWLYNNEECRYIDIKSDDITDVYISSKNWKETNINSYKTYKAKLPVTIVNNGGDNFNTISVTSTEPLDNIAKVFGYCSQSVASGTKTKIDSYDIEFSNGYNWAGNGSIISGGTKDSIGYGRTKDVARVHTDKKSLSAFQWQPSDRCEELRIAGGFNGDKSFNGKLSVKGWNKTSYNEVSNKSTSFPKTLKGYGTSGYYYVIKIETEKGAVSSGYIQAECVDN